MKSKSNPEVQRIIRTMRQKEEFYMPFDYMVIKSSSEESVDVDCRTQMVDWSIKIVDYCNFSRETAAIAVNFLDRFLCHANWALEDRSVFQLAAISCLYTAIKIHEPNVVSSNSMATLSRNKFSFDQIQIMEQIILKELGWHCHPPTTFAFGHYFCRLVAEAYLEVDFGMLWEMTRVQLESCMNVFRFALIQSSVIAFAAVGNAIESYPSNICLPKEEVVNSLKTITNMQSTLGSLREIQRQLYELISNIQLKAPQNCKGNNRVTSPREVSAQDTEAFQKRCIQ